MSTGDDTPDWLKQAIGQKDTEAILAFMRSTFIGEMEEADKRLTEHGTDFDKKTFVRAAFAYVEGAVALAKDSALKSAKANPNLFSDGEIAVLRGEFYDLRDNGTVKTRRMPLRFLSNVRFTLLCRARQLQTTVEVLGPGWDAFGAAVQVRHRLTHPKSLEGSRITDDEMAVVRKGIGWFRAVDSAMTQLAIQQALARIAKQQKTTP